AQELWDAIAGYLDDAVDLKAASLTSRALVPAAQRALFREISISEDEDERWDKGMGFCDPDATVLATRLVQLLQSSPHIVPYVRALTIYMGDAECFEILAPIDWLALRAITFRSFADKVVESDLAGVKALLGCQSLYHVKIGGPLIPWTDELFYSFFRPISPTVQRLEVEYCEVPLTESISTPNTPTGNHPKIRDLGLMISPSIARVLEQAL
ncbi:hypothetical protein R3P38DRAFT_3427310, partial [Favolaschia claudopus]